MSASHQEAQVPASFVYRPGPARGESPWEPGFSASQPGLVPTLRDFPSEYHSRALQVEFLNPGDHGNRQVWQHPLPLLHRLSSALLIQGYRSQRTVPRPRVGSH